MQITMWREKVLQAGDGKCRGPSAKMRRKEGGQGSEDARPVGRDKEFRFYYGCEEKPTEH